MRRSLLPILSILFAVPTAIAPLSLSRADEPQPPASAQLLPSNTAFTMLLDTTAAQWGSLTQFQLFNLAQEFSGEPLSPGSLSLISPDIDYANEIEPWLGETVTIALLPLPNAGVTNRTTIDTQLLVLAPIENPDAFNGFVDRLVATRDQPPLETTYEDIPILYWEAVEAPLPGYEEPFENSPENFPESPDVPLDESPLEEAPPTQPDAPSAPEAMPEVMPESSSINGPGEKTILDEDPPIDFDLEIEPPSTYVVEPGLAIAVLPGHLVLGSDPRAIRQLIDAQNAATPALADTEQFQRTLNNPDYDASLMVMYGNAGEINQYSLRQILLEDFPFPLPLPLPLPDVDLSPSDVEQLSAIDATIESFVKLQPEGIRIQGRIHLDDPLFALLDPPPAADGSTLFSLMPAPTYFMANSRDLAQVWQAVAQLLGSFDETRNWLDFARAAVTGATGLDLDRDIFGWMDGNYAVFLFPTRRGLIPEFVPWVEMGVGAMIQTSDRARAESTFAALNDFIASFDLLVEEQTINDVPAVGWGVDVFGDGEPDYDLLGYSWITEDTVVLTSGARTLPQLLNPTLDEPLSEHYTFQRATESLTTPNQGYYYVNFGSSLSMIYQALSLWIPDSEDTILFKQFLGSIHSFSLTTSQTEAYIQLDFLTVLAPARTTEESWD
ncbi:MAG: DUF3352 domain-containing protein [Cyanobacteria bacterium P01_A01_bin.123]